MLYVEGARDREVLGCWARRAEPSLARCIERNTVILGGRRPARALADFRKRGGSGSGLRGLIVLDRDDHEDDVLEPEASDATRAESGLELFVWGLRHIESYLLVPSALRRILQISEDDPRIERVLADQASQGTAASGAGAIHAKRLLGAGGSLSEALGVELRAGEIARAMRREELHDDVHSLFAQIGRLSGLAPAGPEVVIRPAARPDASGPSD